MSTFTNEELATAIAATDAALHRIATNDSFLHTAKDPGLIVLTDQLAAHHKALLDEQARRAARDSVALAVQQDQVASIDRLAGLSSTPADANQFGIALHEAQVELKCARDALTGMPALHPARAHLSRLFDILHGFVA